MVECDWENKKGEIKIGPVGENPQPDPILDMAILCEAICTLIRVVHSSRLKDESEALRNCIEHLKKGFVDETYKTQVLKNVNDKEGILRELSTVLNGSLPSADQIAWKKKIDSILQ